MPCWGRRCRGRLSAGAQQRSERVHSPEGPHGLLPVLNNHIRSPRQQNSFPGQTLLQSPISAGPSLPSDRGTSGPALINLQLKSFANTRAALRAFANTKLTPCHNLRWLILPNPARTQVNNSSLSGMLRNKGEI